MSNYVHLGLFATGSKLLDGAVASLFFLTRLSFHFFSVTRHGIDGKALSEAFSNREVVSRVRTIFNFTSELLSNCLVEFSPSRNLVETVLT